MVASYDDNYGVSPGTSKWPFPLFTYFREVLKHESMCLRKIVNEQTLDQKKNWVLGLDPNPEEIKKKIKFYECQKFFGSKNT